MIAFRLGVCALLTGALPGCRPPSADDAERVVLVHATLLDGTGRAPLEDAFVEIRGERIGSTGSAAGAPDWEDARIVDASGLWIVPGYVDTHVHLLDSGSLYTSPDDLDLTSLVPHERERHRIREGIDETLDRFLCSGVTTVASLGGPRWELEARARARPPRVLVAGPFLANFPIGELTLWTEDERVLEQVTSAGQARRRVRELLRDDVDLVKAGYVSVPGESPSSFAPVLEAIAEAAQEGGRNLVVHAESPGAARMAVDAGADALAHTVVEATVDAELAAALAERGVVTMTGLAHFARYRAVLESRAGETLLPVEERCGDPVAIASWDDWSGIPAAERPPMPASIRWGSSAEGDAVLMGNIRRLADAGAPIAVGSNGGNVGTLQGPSFHRELLGLAAAGVSLPEILTAATRNGAAALGRLEDRGTIEAGKLADLVLLEADPLASVEAFAAIHAVFVGGRQVYVHETGREP